MAEGVKGADAKGCGRGGRIWEIVTLSRGSKMVQRVCKCRSRIRGARFLPVCIGNYKHAMRER